MKRFEMEKYNLAWPIGSEPVEIEMEMVKRGGRWQKKTGGYAGNGLEFHFHELIRQLWPGFVWHKWAELQVKCYLSHRIIGQIGAASTGKSYVSAACVLADYYCFPGCTTVLVSSTTRESLEMRVWGEIKALHRAAKERYPFLPGHMIEGRQRIVSDPKNMSAEGRDFRNGLCGVACKRGQSFQGMEEYCFPAGTMVDTPSGQRPIESIDVGDLVISAAGPRRVKATMSRMAESLLRIVLSDRRTIDCTPNHEFLTIMGWKNAFDISYGDMLISPHETMQALRKEVHTQGPAGSILRQVLLSEMDSGTAGYGFQEAIIHRLQGNGTENKRGIDGKPKGEDAPPGTNEKTTSIHYGEKEISGILALWREGCGSQEVSGGEFAVDHVSGGTTRLLCADGGMFQASGNPPLLSRFCVAGNQTGCGGRWGLSQEANEGGPEEGQMAGVSWVERVEDVGGGGPEQSNVRKAPYRVYNLSVEGHPSYSVQGCVVHNCGIKNKRLRMLADELQFLPRQFVDSISNMNKNPDFKCVGNGNPKETTDALGVLCEPAAHLGGWDGGMDQVPGAKTWEIRFQQGICIQLPGSDSPNLDGKLGIPLITQEQIDTDIRFYGKDSIQYSMMDEGRMPRGQGSRRVITRQMCLKFGAMEDPVWLNNIRTRIGCLDAAYRGVGGDRCVFMELQFGLDAQRKLIVALVDTLIVPITDSINEMPEDQIAMRVREECDHRGIPPENFGFDSTGRGSLMAAFARIWTPSVIPIEFGGAPSERPVATGIELNCRQYYSKFVTELWYSVRKVIEASQFRGLTDDVMMEGCMREWTIIGSNKIEVEPKDKMKLKSGRSPDLFDCLATGIEVARRRGFDIASTDNTGLRRHTDRWKQDLKDRARALHANHQLSYR